MKVLSQRWDKHFAACSIEVDRNVERIKHIFPEEG